MPMFVNPVYPYVPFLYAQKMSENQTSLGVEKWYIGLKWVNAKRDGVLYLSGEGLNLSIVRWYNSSRISQPSCIQLIQNPSPKLSEFRSCLLIFFARKGNVQWLVGKTGCGLFNHKIKCFILK